MKRTHWSQLTEQEAYSWLMANDPEGAEFWQRDRGCGLKYVVADNLADFGDAPQSGYVQASLHRRRGRR